MKVKPVYLYLGVIIVFIAAVIFFSKTTKDSNKALEINRKSQMPDDDIHGKMKSQGNGDIPSKSNVMQDAVERINTLKADVTKIQTILQKCVNMPMYYLLTSAEEAIKLYERILKVDSKRTDILLQLTFVYFNQGDVKKAEEYNSKVLTVDNNNLICKIQYRRTLLS